MPGWSGNKHRTRVDTGNRVTLIASFVVVKGGFGSEMMRLHDQSVPGAVVLLAGVKLVQLKTYPDHRGELTEIFREEWHDSPLPVHWVVWRDTANALRGIHVHAHHWAYLCALEGELLVGLHDLRPQESTVRQSATIRLDSQHLQTLLIPPGVAHGFYSPADSITLLASSGYYTPSNHFRCRWNSPELGLTWPCTAPKLSAPDRYAGGYAEMKAAFLAGKLP
jgi:dTDP-4-dehydrorhamnose 3,5-epimerase